MTKAMMLLGLSLSICLCTCGCGKDKDADSNYNLSSETTSFTEIPDITTGKQTSTTITSTTVSLSTAKTLATTTTLTTTTTTTTTTQPVTNTVQSPPKETYAFYGIVATESGNLNLRVSPSIDSNIISELPKGTKGSIYYVEGISNWYKIHTDEGLSGYVSAQYIKEYEEIDYTQADTNIDDSSYTTPVEVDISLNISTPIEFSRYSDDTLISTIRLDKVEYDLKLAYGFKSYDTDYDKYYIDLKFYLTKTYDRYVGEQRYSSNPSVYFNIKDLTTGTVWYSSRFKEAKLIDSISTYDMKRAGDTTTYSWSSYGSLSSDSIILDSSHQYIINIME